MPADHSKNSAGMLGADKASFTWLDGFFAPYWSVSIAPLLRSQMLLVSDAVFLLLRLPVLLVKLSEPGDLSRSFPSQLSCRARSMAGPCHFSQLPLSPHGLIEWLAAIPLPRMRCLPWCCFSGARAARALPSIHERRSIATLRHSSTPQAMK